MKPTRHKLESWRLVLRVSAPSRSADQGHSQCALPEKRIVPEGARRVEEHLWVSRAQIRQDFARTRDDFAAAVENELDVWRGRLDELNLQKALGTMEVRDRLTPILKCASLTMDHAKQALHDLSEDEFEEGLTKSVQESLGDLRSEMAAAEEFS